MRLIPNASRVAARAWSVRLMAASFALTAIEAAAPYVIDELAPDPRAASVAIGLITFAALVARFVAQPDIEPAPKEAHEHVDDDQI